MIQHCNYLHKMGLEYCEKTFYGIEFQTEKITLEDFLALLHDYRDLLHYNFVNNIICLKPGSYAISRKRTQVNLYMYPKVLKINKREIPEMDISDYSRIGQLCNCLPGPLTLGWYKIISII